jgi:dihydrofolate synthase/folylpolyglutamate synthase
LSDDPLAYLFGLEQFGIKFGLDNISALVEGLGHPERAFHSVHIGGTNGKGSVTAMVDAALRAAGHRSARYTSPHLIDLTERFVVDGRPVDAGALSAAVADVRHVVDRLREGGTLQGQPTFFEVTTAVAFELFRRAGVHIAVCEVGLGGRLDATNVLEPIATAITSIAVDHQQYLGHTLREIAVEKAGIIKPGVPVVVGELDPDARSAIEGVARVRGARLVDAAAGVTVELAGPAPSLSKGPRIRLRTRARDYGELDLALAGRHQVQNAVVAVGLLETLEARGVRVQGAAIVEGLECVRWPGRLDLRRLPDGREAVLDAAHNPAGAAALAAYLVELSGGRPPLVFAAMRDKDVRGMLRALAPAVGALVLTRASVPRSADPSVLAEYARLVAPDLRLAIEPSLPDALATAWRLSPRIVVAGSLFLLGDVMREVGGP